MFEGVRRIISIVGEPTPDCPASDTSYTYNTHGQILTKTDAKGLITTYAYNDRGLETSRTEASGTPLARTVTTEWGADRFLPVRIVEPDRITVYNYDAQGRELSRRTTSR
nr:RHS repeat domain-containing protein [Pseudomonas syringae]